MTVFSEMRRKCQQLSQEEAIHILSHATSGVLSVIDTNGYPYDNPEEAGIQHEIDKDFTHVAVIEFTIEHITGKEAIELVRERQTGK